MMWQKDKKNLRYLAKKAGYQVSRKGDQFLISKKNKKPVFRLKKRINGTIELKIFSGKDFIEMIKSAT